jgi:hypothetical protein
MSIGVLLAACDKSEPETGPVTAKPKPAVKAPSLGDKFVAAVSHGKSADAIGVHFALGATPQSGQDLPVAIAIVPNVEFSAVRAHFDAQEGITLISGGELAPQTKAGPGKNIEHQLVLRPTVEGVFMVSATLETEGADGSVSRVFSIPIIVSPPAPDPAPDPAPAVPAPVPADPAPAPAPSSG